MKKASKILTLILVFVLLAGMFSGCAMFSRNTGRYRALEAVTVGNEKITVGKILDTFNSYYNTYSGYIGQGITVDWILQTTMQSLVTQSMKVDAYVKSNPAPTDNTGALKEFCHNSEYLTQQEIEYAIRYIKYITYQTFDSSVEDQITGNRTLNDEETEDTSRDFTEPDELEGSTYSEHVYNTRVFEKEAEEYFDKYYGGMASVSLDTSVDGYVFETEAAASKKLESLNDRLSDDDKDNKITYLEYKTAQQKVVEQYKRTIKNSYNMDFDKFVISQVEDMVASIIVAKYDYSINKSIDTTDLEKTIKQLNDNLAINTDSQAAGFELNDNFVSFIESLDSSSYIYNIPKEFERVNTAEKQSGYIFVKNILIPFTSQQTTTLSNLAKDLGNDTDKEAYVNLRNHFATTLKADDFFSTKDEDGNYSKVEGLFEIVEGKLVIKSDVNNPLYGVFKDGKVDITDTDYATQDDAVIDFMKRFNTDTAQHTAQYDYVVRVGDVPADYTAKWVPEFVDAANEAAKGGIGSYALAISTYGVHIVYYAADVVAQDIDFSIEKQNYLDTTKPEYRLFSSYFSQQSSRILADEVEALQKSYVEDKLISTNKNLDRFLKDNGFTFDLIDFLTDDE